MSKVKTHIIVRTRLDERDVKTIEFAAGATSIIFAAITTFSVNAHLGNEPLVLKSEIFVFKIVL